MPRHENLTNATHAELGTRHEDNAKKGTRALHQTVLALGVLFGRPVRQALDLRIEPVVEQYGEACSHYRSALELAYADIHDWQQNWQTERQLHDRDLAELRTLLADAIAWREGHKARLPRRRPAWVDRAQVLIDAAADVEPF